MTSPFIEHSKHAQMTSAVESHFGTASSRTMPGVASGNQFTPGGTSDWNSQQGVSNESGQVNTAPTGAPSGASIFNAPGQTLPRETGVGYTSRTNVGHSIKDDPFSLADGFPGN